VASEKQAKPNLETAQQMHHYSLGWAEQKCKCNCTGMLFTGMPVFKS